jgi:hypothetical protein
VTSVPRLGTASILVALMAAATLVGAAGPAAADTRISSPRDGAVITGSGVTVRANVDGFTGRLLVNGVAVDAGTGGLSHGIDTHSARNGTYRAVLEQRGLTGLFWHHKDDVTFSIRAAPAAPSGTRVSTAGRKVTVSWTRGPEPDLTGYEVTGGGQSKTGSVGSLCSGRSCSATMRVPSSVAGKVGFGVRARRASGSGGSVSSPSSRVYVSFPAGGGAGQVTGESGAAGAGRPGLGPGPRDGRWPIALPPVTPDGAANGFQYPSPEPEVAAPAATGAGAAGRAPPVATGLAIVLVILLAAAHVGVWVRRLRFAPTGASGALLGGGKDTVRLARRRRPERPNGARNQDRNGRPARAARPPRPGRRLARDDLARNDRAPDDLAPDDLAPDDLAPDDLAPDDLAPDDPVLGDPARRLTVTQSGSPEPEPSDALHTGR